MKRWLLVLLIVLAATGAVCVLVIVFEAPDEHVPDSHAETRQPAEDPRQSLRKAAEFLQPDTKSDIRFGRSKASAPTSPAPATPR